MIRHDVFKEHVMPANVVARFERLRAETEKPDSYISKREYLVTGIEKLQISNITRVMKQII